MSEPVPFIDWSKFAEQYTMPSGRTFTHPLLVSCMEQYFFPVMDDVVAKAVAAKTQVRILILAGGPGPEVELLLNRYGRDAFTALLTDSSDVMVQQAAANMQVAGVHDIVETRVMDATQVDVPPASFDVVFMCFGIFAVTEYLVCLEQIASALKPGGIVFLSTPGTVNVPAQLFEEEKRRWNAERHGVDDAVSTEQELRSTAIQRGAWRDVDIVRQRISECITLYVHATVVPVMWTSADEDSIDGLLGTLNHHPIFDMAYMHDLEGDDRKTFLARVRQRALAVGKAEGGLRTESVAVWARKSVL